MRMRTHDRHRMATETSKQPTFKPISFITHFIYLLIDITFLYWQVFFRRVKETNETINLEAHFF